MNRTVNGPHWEMHAESDEDFWGETCTCEIGHDHWAEA